MKEWLKIIAGLMFIIGVFGGWITHVIVCIQTAAWGFLIAGAILAPIGVIHGIGTWLGAW